MLGGVGGGPQVSSALVSLGGVAGLVGAVGGVTSDVFGVGSSWPGPGAGSGEPDGGGGVGCCLGSGLWLVPGIQVRIILILEDCSTRQSLRMRVAQLGYPRG